MQLTNVTMGCFGACKASGMILWRWIFILFSSIAGGLWQVRKILFAAAVAYIIAFLLVLPFICTDLPYCKLYRAKLTDFSSALKINNLRIEKAQKFMQTLNHTATKKSYEKHKENCCPRYAIGVVTIARKPRSNPTPLYLTQVMMRLQEIILAENATSEVTLFICNVDRYPSQHAEAKNLSQYFPMISKYEELPQLLRGPYKNSFELEKSDYKYCLKQTLNYNPNYVILLQDDVYAYSNFYSLMDHIVRTKLEYRIAAGEYVKNREDWVWLKMNIPRGLVFYERNWYFALEWVTLSILFSGALTLIYYVCNYHSCGIFRSGGNSGSRGSPHVCRAYVVFILSFLFCFLFLVVLGRPYISHVRSVSKHSYTLGPGTSCCITAMLYPAKQVPYIINYLNHIKCDNFLKLDFALDDYRAEMNYRQYLVSPNLFQHIGLYSGLRKSYNLKAPHFYLD